MRPMLLPLVQGMVVYYISPFATSVEHSNTLPPPHALTVPAGDDRVPERNRRGVWAALGSSHMHPKLMPLVQGMVVYCLPCFTTSVEHSDTLPPPHTLTIPAGDYRVPGA